MKMTSEKKDIIFSETIDMEIFTLQLYKFPGKYFHIIPEISGHIFPYYTGNFLQYTLY